MINFDPTVKDKDTDLAECKDVTPASSGAQDRGLRELEQLGLHSREDGIAVPGQPLFILQ